MTTKNAELKLERVVLADLKPHPKNPRRLPEPGSAEWESLRKSLAVDYFDPIVVNSGVTHRELKNVLVSGHLRVKILLADSYTRADAVVKDYDEARHVQVMLRANNQSGEWDETMLAELLKEIPETDLDLTGFEQMEIDRMLSAWPQDAVNNVEEAMEGMPEFSQDHMLGIRLIVYFKTREDRRAFGKLIGQVLGEKTKTIWFPKVEKKKAGTV